MAGKPCSAIDAAFAQSPANIRRGTGMTAEKPFPITFLHVSRTVAPPHRRRAGQLQLRSSALSEEAIIDYKRQVPMSLDKTNKFRADSVSRSMIEFFRIAEGNTMTCRARDGVVRCKALLLAAMRTHTTQNTTQQSTRTQSTQSKRESIRVSRKSARPT